MIFPPQDNPAHAHTRDKLSKYIHLTSPWYAQNVSITVDNDYKEQKKNNNKKV